MSQPADFRMTTRRIPFLLLALLLVLPLASCANGGAADEDDFEGSDLSGTWLSATDRPSEYVVESTDERPQGAAVPHDQVDLVARRAEHVFRLEERDDGIVVGENAYTAYDLEGNEVHSEVEAVLGARAGDRVILVEAHDEGGTAQLVFEMEQVGPDRLEVIGYDVGAVRLVAMRFDLVRESGASE